MPAVAEEYSKSPLPRHVGVPIFSFNDNAGESRRPHSHSREWAGLMRACMDPLDVCGFVAKSRGRILSRFPRHMLVCGARAYMSGNAHVDTSALAFFKLVAGFPCAQADSAFQLMLTLTR